MIPPWLWVWLVGDLAVLIPAEAGDERDLFTTYTGHGDIAPSLTAGTPYKLLFAFAVLAALTYVILAIGAISCLFPQWRGRWVEKHYGLRAEDRDEVAEIQRFVSRLDPGIEIRVAINGGQMARVYPVGWRTARIAVFLPLIALWNNDRTAAEAILRHEIAHHRHGDQFAVGLGSPFVWLIRVWVPAFAVLVLAPLAVYFALGGGALATAVAGQGALELFQPAELLLLPVTALWLAELNADQLTADTAGPAALQNALRATASVGVPLRARLLTLLSHPPRRLRSRLAKPRPAVMAGLLAAWPVVLVVQLVLLVIAALIAYLLISESAHATGVSLLAGVHLFLVSNRVLIIAEGVLLLCWPILLKRQDGPADSLPWQSYLVAALVPVVLFGASFTPLPVAFPQEPGTPPTACARLADWDSAGGITAKKRVDAAIKKMVAEIESPAATGMVEQAAIIEADTAAALRVPPPSAARASYDTAMTDFRAFASALLALNAKVAGADLGNGIAAETKTSTLLAAESHGCVHGALSPSGQTAQDRLQHSLLSSADLPAGFAPYVLTPTLPVSSNKPACMTTLNNLTTTAYVTTASVTQAGIAFAAGTTGPELVEVLRSYADEATAAAAFTAVTTTLAACHQFTVRWTNPPASATESVRTPRALHLGNQSWSASVTVGASGVQETLLAIRTGGNVAFIQILLAAGEPTSTQIKAIAQRAATKLGS